MRSERALITGASSGIGLELAREFARHGHPLIITAPVESELHDVARELEAETGVSVRLIPKDLEEPGAAEGIYETTRRKGEAVQILVNNAGLGHLGRFWELPIDSILSMIRLNVEAVVRLTRLFLPDMVQRKRGRLLNTASVAGFEPGPQMATYHATKAFVLSLSESLVEELKDTGVTVTALCPGVTDADFLPKARMSETRLFQQGNVMAPQEVAAEGYEALMRGDPLCVVGGLNKAQVFARRFMTKSAQAKMAGKMYAKVPPGKRKRRRGDVELAEYRKAA
jgi:short-subunit dehydrogenase